jgi:SAM-dependent methyltransferase
MHFEMRQRGRASVDFLADLGLWYVGLAPGVDAEMTARGLTEATLAPDLDERLAQVDATLADSPTFWAWSGLNDWLAERHGKAAAEAFEEIHADLAPAFDRLARGPATLEHNPSLPPPDYYAGVDFHRTTGGWDGHPHQGFIHGEIIHKRYVAKNYPGDIFGQRRDVLKELPPGDYRDIFEMGTSAGHFTQALAEHFPQACITGCDVSAIMLEQAQRTANEHGWAWRLKQCHAEATGEPGGSYDLVCSFALMHELPARAIAAIFREAFRLLRPGGRVLMCDLRRFSDMNRREEWRAYRLAVHGGEPYWREAATVDLAATARDAGFADVASYGLEPLHYPWITLGRKPGAAS